MQRGFSKVAGAGVSDERAAGAPASGEREMTPENGVLAGCDAARRGLRGEGNLKYKRGH
jgi:hypothetical protein